MNVRKFSAKREEILNLLLSTKSHPGAYWVYERLKPKIPDLSLGTVYRNLDIFCREGKAVSVGVVAGEERYDGITEPHPHLVCSRCGAVLDLPESRTETLLKGYFSVEDAFFIDFRNTVFYGLCRECYKDYKKNGGDPDGA
jgi:Fur family peroxide stress response transcriptional regulator